jgi:CDP-glycerol glycerophosphotransferase
MDVEVLHSYKKYKRRILSAFYHGNMKKATKVVIRHLAWRKLIKLIKNKKELPKFIYKKFFLRLSVKENWVFCESFFGKNYSDSPKYVYEYLQKDYPGKYRFIWVIDKKHTKIPYRHTKVKRFSLRYLYYLARCKYYIFNGRQPVWIKKRKENVFLQTWHGTPLKKLVFDLEDINSATPRYKNQTYQQSRSWDYLIAANQYSSDIFRRCFMYEKECWKPDIREMILCIGITRMRLQPRSKKSLVFLRIRRRYFTLLHGEMMSIIPKDSTNLH